MDPKPGGTSGRLLAVEPPEVPRDFEHFWLRRRERAQRVAPKPKLRDTAANCAGWRLFDLSYSSTDRVRVKGWLLLPSAGAPRRGFVVGHGYSGPFAPVEHLPFPDAALLFFCARGLGLTRHSTISSDPAWHVLHDIQDRDRYVLGGCVDDVWCGVSALLRICPEVAGHVGYLGISFSGGIGALALPWEERVQRMHVNVPTFGHHPLRLERPSIGSAASVQRFVRKYPAVRESTLPYFDAAVAARFARQAALFACAGEDPAVAPEGQYAIYNSWGGERTLFALTAGHRPYAAQEREERELLQEIDHFFRDL